MPKIAFLINSLSGGGAEKVLALLINEFRKNNVDFKVICIEQNISYDIKRDIDICFLTSSNGKSNGLIKLLQIPFLAWKLKKYIEQNKLEIVQSHLYRANYINVLAKIFGSNHTVQIVNHGIASLYKSKGLLGKINIILIKKLYPKAALLITVSKGMMLDLKQLIKSRNNEKVINNPYDINEIQKKRKEQVEDFDFDKNKIYIVSVGRLINLKRNRDIIIALQKFSENVELILIGDGEEKENLQKLVKRLKLRHRVHFLGRKQNPFKYMSRCDIFVNCSESEGFPNVLIEALACELPIISSDCLSGPREILAPKTNITFQLKKGIEEAEFGKHM